jgi:quinol-cytochrome oxidoreductase complex cytochrome b subunit
MRLVTSNLILHLHPRSVSSASIRFTYTFGLGGLAILLLVILVGTGTLLMFAYTPSPNDAYSSIVRLETQIWFGQLIRNLHHWSANLLLVIAGLHLLRVFYTGAFLPPRAYNWQLGLFLLALVIIGNFTGYLLPWDQLSYWAITVSSSLVDHTPLVGPAIRRLMLGGDTVSGTTLQYFFALHIILVPVGLFLIGAFHIWRVRKDKMSAPPGQSSRVPTIPHLVNREMIFALMAIALLLAWATWVDAPLESAANPNNPPDPTKTAWYFAGVQELLLHFHPVFAATVIPLMLVGALGSLPYWPDSTNIEGVWFRSRRGLRLTILSFIVGIVAAVALVLAREVRPELEAVSSFVADGLLPLGVILLGLWAYVRILILRGANHSEIKLAVFTLLLAAFLTLTIIGVYFRGPGMALEVPGI